MIMRLFFGFAFIVSSYALAQNTSTLWGENGEAWTPDGRLPDFSFAGYRRGEAEIPTPAVTHNVKDFGAVGDGETDDSDAFIKALSEVSEDVNMQQPDQTTESQRWYEHNGEQVEPSDLHGAQLERRLSSSR